MAELLAVGKEFKSFDALQEAVYQYEQTCFAQLSRTDSRTIENEESRRSSKLFNPDIKYSFVTFTCAFGGKPYVSRSTGVRNSKPRIKCNCPVTLKCYASSDGQKLVIRHSQLDCHNHDTSEESFKSLPRGKLLDEETEQEIYDLIQSHENKKLARKLVKEKLIQETGRDITYKDIQNIEKRMSKKINPSEKNGRSEDDDYSDASMPSEDEDPKESGDQDENEVENGDEASPNSKEKVSKIKNTPKKRASNNPATANSQTRSSGRPKREIREPTRFRDPSVSVSSSVLKRRASESDNSWEGSDSEIAVKSQPQSTGKRGRPPKMIKQDKKEAEDGVSADEGSDSEHTTPKTSKESSSGDSSKKNSSQKSDNDRLLDRQLEMEERRLKMQEEMLNLQRQSMLLLQNMVTKLERVEANQKGDSLAVTTPSDKVEVQDKVAIESSDLNAMIESSEKGNVTDSTNEQPVPQSSDSGVQTATEVESASQ